MASRLQPDTERQTAGEEERAASHIFCRLSPGRSRRFTQQRSQKSNADHTACLTRAVQWRSAMVLARTMVTSGGKLTCFRFPPERSGRTMSPTIILAHLLLRPAMALGLVRWRRLLPCVKAAETPLLPFLSGRATGSAVLPLLRVPSRVALAAPRR
jgi:hypothetical protein